MKVLELIQAILDEIERESQINDRYEEGTKNFVKEFKTIIDEAILLKQIPDSKDLLARLESIEELSSSKNNPSERMKKLGLIKADQNQN
jgi:hypothetical protein